MDGHFIRAAGMKKHSEKFRKLVQKPKKWFLISGDNGPDRISLTDALSLEG